ncbi:MAG: C2 family cysteine protease [bacterium]
MWAAIFEKAWSKMKGNYLATESGYISEGINALTGIPVF